MQSWLLSGRQGPCQAPVTHVAAIPWPLLVPFPVPGNGTRAGTPYTVTWALQWVTLYGKTERFLAEPFYQPMGNRGPVGTSPLAGLQTARAVVWADDDRPPTDGVRCGV